MDLSVVSRVFRLRKSAISFLVPTGDRRFLKTEGVRVWGLLNIQQGQLTLLGVGESFFDIQRVLHTVFSSDGSSSFEAAGRASVFSEFQETGVGSFYVVPLKVGNSIFASEGFSVLSAESYIEKSGTWERDAFGTGTFSPNSERFVSFEKEGNGVFIPNAIKVSFSFATYIASATFLIDSNIWKSVDFSSTASGSALFSTFNLNEGSLNFEGIGSSSFDASLQREGVTSFEGQGLFVPVPVLVRSGAFIAEGNGDATFSPEGSESGNFFAESMGYLFGDPSVVKQLTSVFEGTGIAFYSSQIEKESGLSLNSTSSPSFVVSKELLTEFPSIGEGFALFSPQGTHFHNFHEEAFGTFDATAYTETFPQFLPQASGSVEWGSVIFKGISFSASAEGLSTITPEKTLNTGCDGTGVGSFSATSDHLMKLTADNGLITADSGLITADQTHYN